jgi:hypothetical protein
MSDIDIHHLSAAYALDALDSRERLAFEAHYPSCDVCRADVQDFRSTLTQMAGATVNEPSTSVRNAVMTEIAQTRQLSPLLPAVVSDLAERRRRRQRALAGILVAAALVGVFIAGGALMNRSEAGPSYADDLAMVLDQSDGRVVALDGTAAGAGTSTDGGAMKVAWSESRELAVFMGDGLHTAPVGEAYELWMIGPDGPVAMSVLDSARDGTIRATLVFHGSPVAWGVTLEPVTGSPIPTSDVIYLGTA